MNTDRHIRTKTWHEVTISHTHLLPLHDLCQSVWFILWRKRGKVDFLLLQTLIIQPHGKYAKQPIDGSSLEIRGPVNALKSATAG